MFDSLLIANRGEIAVRVIRACRELGIRSVAVFSEADRRSLHVLEADQAFCVGPPPSAESYLRIDRILEVAEAAGVQAIHPGYGFLAERALFSRAVQDAGFVFVGPTPETIEAMGDKTEARRRMQAAGVPIVPGVTEAVSSPDDALVVAGEIGFPVLLKASAGGGGKGMRVVERPADLAKAFEAASREARAAFGDGSVYLERFLDAPRHIEIQIMGDRFGRVIHLGERECSIQRRHQKLIEEAPSAIVSPELRQRMGAAAVRAAEAVDYVGAGTVEFLYKDGEFFFLEMNTRLQVEHPVTELVYGVDLVELQLRMAAGEPLTLKQEALVPTGHSIECRITSEDPHRGFLPSTGRIDYLRFPGGPGVRWDGGIINGFEVGLHYDPLLGKLIVHAPSRESAIRRMARALDEIVIRGVETSVPFHRKVMDEKDFREGNISIRYLEDHPDLMDGDPEEGLLRAAAAAAALLQEKERSRLRITPATGGDSQGLSAWRRAGWPFSSRR
ncbi:MAG: acetyl-CoA carboxylase biotin carboxylase subunit [Longimicrobiales bacterium]|nr:acetyl-CoA carboxylase biotin carboxylase subunit [Longimicrobiales bacterium]